MYENWVNFWRKEAYSEGQTQGNKMKCDDGPGDLWKQHLWAQEAGLQKTANDHKEQMTEWEVFSFNVWNLSAQSLFWGWN